MKSPRLLGDFWHPSWADAGTLTSYIQACGCKGVSQLGLVSITLLVIRSALRESLGVRDSGTKPPQLMLGVGASSLGPFGDKLGTPQAT